MNDFRSVKGQYFLEQINYASDRCPHESVIESVFNNCFMMCTNCLMTTIKEPTNNGITDGVITFKMPDGQFLGNGLMEVKRNISFGGEAYRSQLKQVLAYYYSSIIDKRYKVLLLTSARYFSYIWIPENMEAVTELAGMVSRARRLHPSVSASELPRFVSDDWSLDLLTIHSWDITPDFDFLDPITEIYSLLNEA